MVPGRATAVDWQEMNSHDHQVGGSMTPNIAFSLRGL